MAPLHRRDHTNSPDLSRSSIPDQEDKAINTEFTYPLLEKISKQTHSIANPSLFPRTPYIITTGTTPKITKTLICPQARSVLSHL